MMECGDVVHAKVFHLPNLRMGQVDAGEEEGGAGQQRNERTAARVPTTSAHKNDLQLSERARPEGAWET